MASARGAGGGGYVGGGGSSGTGTGVGVEQSSQINLIEIDGSYLEGGGQILRITTALSILLNKPIRITKIRAGRKDGGLKPQHLTGINLIGELCDAKMYGNKLQSTELTFIPSKLKSGRFLGDTKTAGSICLLIQNCLPCLIFARDECKLDLRGGTNAEHAPQIDYFQMVFANIAEKLGIKIDIEILRRGYYPKGGGEIYLKTHANTKALNPIDLTQFGQIKRAFGRSFVAGLSVKIAQTMASTATDLLRQLYGDIPIDIAVVKEPDHTYVGVGTGIIVIVETTTGCLISGSSLGKKGVPAEAVATEAVESLNEDIKHESCVDQYMQDQLIIFMSLANGKSKVKTGPLTLHTKTAIYFTELLTGVKFNVTPADTKNSFYIECEGINFT